jgi:hypothetical protein
VCKPRVNRVRVSLWLPFYQMVLQRFQMLGLLSSFPGICDFSGH